MSDISPAGYAALHVPRSLSADWEAPSRGGGLSIVYREYVVVRRNRLADEFRPSTCVLQLVRLCSSPSLAYALPHLQTTVDVYCLVDVDTRVVPRTRTVLVTGVSPLPAPGSGTAYRRICDGQTLSLANSVDY